MMDQPLRYQFTWWVIISTGHGLWNGRWHAILRDLLKGCGENVLRDIDSLLVGDIRNV